ncbi:hypothetical protein Leryth_027653 [Lithospermum erythrorhizon]|nr:hypothetical protein Leryth_027653 [Lithospermum erythrorhizon]
MTTMLQLLLIKKKLYELEFTAIARELRQLNFTKIVSLAPEFIMGRDTIAEIITSIRNADMDRKSGLNRIY